MTEHMTTWLEAYHDGELRGRRMRQVEAHLADCATCRAELEKLQALAALLQESPAPRNLMPSERFVAQVGLRLPRPPGRPAWQRTLEIGWRLSPLALFGAWAFGQAVFVVAGLALGVLQMGPKGNVVAGLLPTSQQGAPLAELFNLSGAALNDASRIMLWLLSNGGPLGWGVTLSLLLQVVIGLLYWSWLAGWWAYRQRRQL